MRGSAWLIHYFLSVFIVLSFSYESRWLVGARFSFLRRKYFFILLIRDGTYGAEEVCWASGELEELSFTTCLNIWLGVLVATPHTSLWRRSEGISSTRFGFSRAGHFFICFNGLIQNEQCGIVQRMFFRISVSSYTCGHGHRLQIQDWDALKVH